MNQAVNFMNLWDKEVVVQQTSSTNKNNEEIIFRFSILIY